MKSKINILVTGCGGDIGQSVGKILNELSYVNEIYGCDISDMNAAKFIYKNFFIGLACNNPEYLNNLKKFVQEKNINVVMPISEPELRFFSKNRIFSIGNAKMIIANEESLKIGFDKLETANFLKNENLPFPFSFDINEVNTLDNFPVIVKSRTGSGSSSVFVVKDNESFLHIKKSNKNCVVQEYLESKEEYTCGLFRSKSGIIRTIIIKRVLMGGFTGYGEVINNESINHLLNEIALKLKLVGSINVQLKLAPKGPVVFEINPRFSSTVRFRDLLGFKDVEWSIEDILEFPLSDYKDNSNGRKIYKGFIEYIK